MQSLFPNRLPWSHLRYSPSSNTKPRDPSSCNMVKHLLTTGISVPPYLGISKPRKTPNLNRFYKRKRKNWAHLIKNWNDMFGNWSISTRDLLSSKNYDFQKKYTLFHFLWKNYPSYSTLLNFTSLVIIQTSKWTYMKNSIFLCSILTIRTTVRL